MVSLFTTDSNYNVLNVLVKQLEGKTTQIGTKNLIFCEEKISLMVERRVCSVAGGTFNTEVYSFGKFLRSKKTFEKLLSKEGSAMVIRRIISNMSLKTFKGNKANLAPALFDLIILLKSAKITVDELAFAVENTKGILKNKLTDIKSIYSEYENYVTQNGFEDQSSVLLYLPQILLNDPELKNANVYLVGYSSWTMQARSIVEAIVKTAKDVTAILNEGENQQVFVNETARLFKQICEKLGKTVNDQFINSSLSEEGRIITDTLFSPKCFVNSPINTEKITLYQASSTADEIEYVAQKIKRMVMRENYRYRDFSIAVPEGADYQEEIIDVFKRLNVPFFLDEKKKLQAHALVRIIVSYIECFRKNKEREYLCEFFKNPLFSNDKDFTDKFENYLLEYNIDYSQILRPFTIGEDIGEFEEFRTKLCLYLSDFNIEKLLRDLDVENKLSAYSTILELLGHSEEAALNNQIYAFVTNLLSEIKMILEGIDISLLELKNIFTSGINASTLSILPQFNDAVFIGGFKEVSLVQAPIVFSVGLTSLVPDISEDVALLSDNDLDELENIKVLVEPKIKAVNKRVRESKGNKTFHFLGSESYLF